MIRRELLTEGFSAVLVSLLVLAAGASLEWQFGDDHFERSGALLVLLAFWVAAIREFRSKVSVSDYINERFESLEIQSKLHEARYKVSEREKRVKKMTNELRQVEGTFVSRQKKANSGNESVRKLLATALSEVEVSKIELKSLKTKYDRSNVVLGEMEKKLVAKKLQSEKRKLSHSEMSSSTHFGEIIAGTIGTVIWAYGGLIIFRS